MNNSLRNASLISTVALVLSSSGAWSQAPATESDPARSSEVEAALSVVEEYIAAEKASASERVASRNDMLEFKFKSTRENGRYRLLSENAWRKWETDRSSDREVQRLQVIGEPVVEELGSDLVKVHCAVHLSMVEDGESWEGVSLRSFEVRMDDEGTPRIRHERLLANREGIRPGGWRRYKKAETKSGRSNLRSSPTSKQNNVIGKAEAGDVLHIWDQEDEGWLLARTSDGLVGFIHRSQIDFDAKVTSAGTGDSGAAGVPPKPKTYPFALPLPGKPGYVMNPYTNTMVDVRGLRAGTLVRDPRDSVKDRPFRVPFSGQPVRALIVDEDDE